MNIKRGSIVVHTRAKEWGAGKVVDVNENRAVIDFNDGVVRKIVSSHFFRLEPAGQALHQQLGEPLSAPSDMTSAAPKRKTKKGKAVA